MKMKRHWEDFAYEEEKNDSNVSSMHVRSITTSSLSSQVSTREPVTRGNTVPIRISGPCKPHKQQYYPAEARPDRKLQDEPTEALRDYCGVLNGNHSPESWLSADAGNGKTGKFLE